MNILATIFSLLIKEVFKPLIEGLFIKLPKDVSSKAQEVTAIGPPIEAADFLKKYDHA